MLRSEECADPVDDPAKEPAVERFGHGVPVVCGLMRRVVSDDELSLTILLFAYNLIISTVLLYLF